MNPKISCNLFAAVVKSSSMEWDWTELVHRLGPTLYRFFLARHPAVAEDLVQEVFVRLIEKIEAERYDSGQGSIVAYAWGIAINLHREVLRTHKPTECLTEAHHPILESEGPETDRRRDLVALAQAVNQIGEPMRTVLQMVMSGASIAEIAETLSMPDGTVKSHIHRAKDITRNKLKEWGINV